MANWMPGVAALLGLTMASPVLAEPYDRYRGGARARDYRYESYGGRVGFEKGYEDGLKRGRRDGDRGDRFDPTRDGRYREGDHGYKSRYGPRSLYVRSYRRGYEEGYRDGFAPYRGSWRGSYGRNGSGRYDAYDYQRDGRHRHRGVSGWCRADHRYDDRGVIYERPRY